jgi:WxL Interacting Protein, peptidoglycan binding domain
MRLRLSVVTAALLCGVAVVSTTAAAAAGGASFALKPITYDPALTATKSYFILVARPGAVIQDRIRIVNTGSRTGTAYLYPVDATTGQTSGAVYLSRQSPRHDVGAWIRLARSTVTLGPGKDAVVPFTIRVPRSVRPGDHLGGIVAENALVATSSGHGALQIRIKHLTIDAVELQLPGRVVARADVSGVKPGGEHGYQYVYLHLLNPGTIMIKPAGSLVIRNSRGRRVARRSLLLDTFLPRTAIDYPTLLPRQALSPGRYTATVNLHSGNQRVLGYRRGQGAAFDVTRTFSFVVSPKEQTKVYSGTAALAPPPPATAQGGSNRRLLRFGIAALAGLLGLGLALMFGLRRRVRARMRKQPPAAAAAVAVEAIVPPVVTPVEEEEEPGWAGLLAAYDSSPREDGGWNEPDPVEEPALADELDPVRLRELIVEHDLALADAYFRPDNGSPTRTAATAPEANGWAPSRSRTDVDVNGLSSALLEAALVALAALVAARLLRGAD